MGWWGSGLSPCERWPGTTIDIKATWSAGKGRWETSDSLYWFDAAEAKRACDFFPSYLRHHIGEFAGEPFELLDYQRLQLTMPLFGWKRTADNLRRFRKVFAFLPKGSGKSPWGAGTGLYLAFCDGEPGASVYAVAADKKQARTVHDNARIMVEGMQEIEPEFKDLFKVLRDSIECGETHSTYEVISADAGTKHGFRPHGVIFDEFHAQKNRQLYEALKKSLAKRRQPLMVIITHAGYDDEGICFEEYEYAKAVLKGERDDDTCLPVIFEMTPQSDWTDPVEWSRVNPGHGITVKHDGVAIECKEAQNEPRKLNDFLMFHGNRWMNQATAWIPIDWWDRCADPVAPDAELALLPCAAGLDLAQKIDLASLVVTFRHRLEQPVEAEVLATEGETVVKRSAQLNYRITLVPFFWIPEDTMKHREKEDGVPYSRWVTANLVTVTEGATIDYDRIFSDITTKILPRFPRLRQSAIGYDPAFATDIANSLRKFAGRDAWCLEVLQNFPHMTEPCFVFEALIKAKRVSHGGHRVLRNHIETVAVKRDDAGRIRPVRPKKAGKHIDGVVATLMGLRMLTAQPDEETGPQMFFLGGR